MAAEVVCRPRQCGDRQAHHPGDLVVAQGLTTYDKTVLRAGSGRNQLDGHVDVHPLSTMQRRGRITSYDAMAPRG
ncbi:hypothetical protein GR254_09580 [Mycobacterium tuberculosis]|nr:hypothetical protein [Mycobacterium tuberculosis]